MASVDLNAVPMLRSSQGPKSKLQRKKRGKQGLAAMVAMTQQSELGDI